MVPLPGESGGYNLVSKFTRLTSRCFQFFLLDAMDNLPRLRISESLMKLFIFFLKELGVKQVPTIGAFRKFQASLRTSGAGVPSIPCTSVQGKVFYMNDVRKLVANVSLSYGSSVLF